MHCLPSGIYAGQDLFRLQFLDGKGQEMQGRLVLGDKDEDEEKYKNKDNSGIGEKGQEPQGELVTFDKKL